jgi:hypothetical protein
VKLFLWKLSQTKNNDYDTYSDAVVVSSNPVAAKRIHPATDSVTGERVFRYVEDQGWVWDQDGNVGGWGSWANPKDIQVSCVGEAADWLGEGAVVCSSFHAG